MSDSTLASGEGQLRSAWFVAAFGFFALAFEGYDLIVYGSAVPTLLAYPDWHLTPAQVGVIGAYRRVSSTRTPASSVSKFVDPSVTADISGNGLNIRR
jgi:hypothetical protein